LSSVLEIERYTDWQRAIERFTDKKIDREIEREREMHFIDMPCMLCH
jgi:hypothetical protein